MAPITETKVIGWLMPALLSGSLGVLGWIGVTSQKSSENLAIMAYRLEEMSGELKQVKSQVRYLETYAVIRKKPNQ